MELLTLATGVKFQTKANNNR